jgi:hypothetical protein
MKKQKSLIKDIQAFEHAYQKLRLALYRSCVLRAILKKVKR